MTERMVSAEAVVSAITGGQVVYEGSHSYLVLKRLQLLDMLPPWYVLEVLTEDGWEIMDDELEDLAEARDLLAMRQKEDTEPKVPPPPYRKANEPPGEYAKRVQCWAVFSENTPAAKPGKYRIREHRFGKRPRTV